MARVDQTSASRKVRGRFAVLSGVVAASGGPVSYRFQYGSRSRYSTVTTTRILPGSTTDQAVTAIVRGLLPGTVYHYRLVVTDAAGTIRYGANKTRGIVAITVTTADSVIARHRVTVTATCSYTSTFRLTALQLPGSGRASFSVRYAGNDQLRARQARTLNARYGA